MIAPDQTIIQNNRSKVRDVKEKEEKEWRGDGVDRGDFDDGKEEGGERGEGGEEGRRGEEEKEYDASINL